MPNRVTDTARIAASIDAWTRKLLDLTKRNRALHFRPTKVSTITVVHEQPAEVFRQLVMRDEALRFTPAPERASTPREPNAPNEPDAIPDLDGDDAELPATDFAPYDSATLGEHHTDAWLRTTLVPDALDRSLRRLDEQARSALDEQGGLLGTTMVHNMVGAGLAFCDRYWPALMAVSVLGATVGDALALVPEVG